MCTANAMRRTATGRMPASTITHWCRLNWMQSMTIRAAARISIHVVCKSVLFIGHLRAIHWPISRPLCQVHGRMLPSLTFGKFCPVTAPSASLSCIAEPPLSADSWREGLGVDGGVMHSATSDH